jgi:hypothetical protein
MGCDRRVASQIRPDTPEMAADTAIASGRFVVIIAHVLRS